MFGDGDARGSPAGRVRREVDDKDMPCKAVWYLLQIGLEDAVDVRSKCSSSGSPEVSGAIGSIWSDR